MGRPTKFNATAKADILELCGNRGYSYTRCAKLIGVSMPTFNKWLSLYDLRKEVEALRESSAKECIEVGLRKLASGSSEGVTKEKYIIMREITTKVQNEETGEIEEVQKLIPVELTKEIKEKLPDSKAIEILARKYYKDFDPKSESESLVDTLLTGFNMRQLQDARANNPIDLGAIEVESTSLDN